ncbi:hypothetical protein P9139_15925 [Curtobacterium flaccumfaciens]|nr:hypothetical protein P9139_15925 [Curtobacterium flaccumfaciens]
MAPADARDLRNAREPRVRFARRTDVLVAAGTAVLALGLLLGLPPLDAVDPDGTGTGMRYPAVGGVAWTALAVALLAQAAVLLAARRAPRTTLVVVAGLTAVLALTSTSQLFGLSALPVVVAVVLAALRIPLPASGRRSSWPPCSSSSARPSSGQRPPVRSAPASPTASPRRSGRACCRRSGPSVSRSS